MIDVFQDPPRTAGAQKLEVLDIPCSVFLFSSTRNKERAAKSSSCAPAMFAGRRMVLEKRSCEEQSELMYSVLSSSRLLAEATLF